MESILNKTCQSLEAALRYNPNSLELMASLAEVYIRMSRFDARTMELCEAVLDRQPDNLLLQQAQSIALMIEQARALEANLLAGEPAPPSEALRDSIDSLKDFLNQTPECSAAWEAWTRFHILLGAIDSVRKGMDRLQALGVTNPAELFVSMLEWAGRQGVFAPEQAHVYADLLRRIDHPDHAIGLLEELYDGGAKGVGKVLLDYYLSRYPIDCPEDVPELQRPRMLELLLDYGAQDISSQWLHRALVAGLEVSSFMVDYGRHLIKSGQIDEAYNLMQNISMDNAVRELLNEIAEVYEGRDEIDKAVHVLRYINDNELVEIELNQQRERDLSREAALTMAEMQHKNGRYSEAFGKYVEVICLSDHVDPDLLHQIEDIQEQADIQDVSPFWRLGQYFRKHHDTPKAIHFYTQALERDPANQEMLREMERLYHEILDGNANLPHLRLELGRVYIGMGKQDEAIKEFKLAATSPTIATQANRLQAEVQLEKAHFQDAFELFRGLPAEEADCPHLYTLYEGLNAQRRSRDALTCLEMIARVKPEYADVGQRIAELESSLGGPKPPETNADSKMREFIGDLAIGRYEYIERLGAGGMGVVHKVRDIRNNLIVAMKILRNGLSGSSKALDRFFREARIAATLHHRNIVAIYDYNISNIDGQSYIVLEFVDGPSLREIVDRQFSSTASSDQNYINEILYYAIQLCDALDISHQKGIIHRDIKPDNIMINSEGMVKITDFGIVHIEDATFTPTGAMLGTPRYMAPEQVTGGKIDGRSDIYSVGILLYETLTGAPPFVTGDVSYQQVHNQPLSPKDINPMISDGCSAIIMQCLEKDPDNRFKDAHELKNALEREFMALGGCDKFENQTHTIAAEAGKLPVPGMNMIQENLDPDLDLDLDLD